MVMVANTAPWTSSKPAIGPFPRASFDRGLDLYGLRTLRTISTLRQGASGRLAPGNRAARPRGCAPPRPRRLRVTAARPVALQVDGEPFG